MQPEALTKFTQLVQEINQLLKLEDHGSISDLTFRRLENEAKKLVEASPGESFSIRGMISCLKGNIDEMHRYHRLSLKYEESDIYYTNYSASLENLGFLDEAYEYALKAYHANIGSAHMLSNVLELANLTGKENEFQEYAEAYKRLTGEEHSLLRFPEDDPETLNGFFDIAEDLMENQPEMIVKPDKKMVELAFKLVEGVDLNC